MATRFRSDAQKFTHSNFATSTGGATKTLPSNCTSILIKNVDTSISVSVCLEAGGSTFFTVKAGEALSVDCDNLASYQIKSASSTPNVECIYGSEN